MHILLTPSWYPTIDRPLTGIFFRDQAQALKKAGLQVGVIYPHIRSLADLQKREAVRINGRILEDDDGVAVMRHYGWSWVPHAQRIYHRLWIRTGHKLFTEYVKKFGRPDLLHGHVTLRGGMLAHSLSQRWGTPYVITEHASTYALTTVRSWLMPIIQAALLHADSRIVVSPALGTLLEQTLGSAVVTPWTWVPNLLPSEYMEEPPPITREPNEAFVFLNASLMTPNKRLDDLLHAFADCFSQQKHIRLTLAGDGVERPHLEQVASDLGITDQVTFLGMLSRDRMLAAMQACDGFVLCSGYETFGVVLIEAMACGKPVISTACGGPEYVVNKNNGLLVPVGDRKALGEAMEQLIASQSNYDPASIRMDCLDRFGGTQIIQQLIQIYRNAIAQSVTTAKKAQ